MVKCLGHIAVRGCRTAFLGHMQDILCQSPEQLNWTLNLGFYWAQQLLEVPSSLWELMVLSDSNWRGHIVFLQSSCRLNCTWFLTQPKRVKISEWRIGAKIAWPCVTPAMLVYLGSVVNFSFVLCIGVKMKTGTSVCIHPSVSLKGRTQLTDVSLSVGPFLESDLWAFSSRSFFRRRLNNLFFFLYF